jgi:large subunit ribosomal protein L25
MSNQIKLAARPRVGVGRKAAKDVRERESVPAVIYGAKQPALGLEINRKEIERILAHAGGENFLVDLEIQTEGQPSVNRLALIQEVQHHALRREILHVDFHAVSRDEKLTTEVQIESVGEPEGVKTFGGLLTHSLRELEIECFPQDLPSAIIVDVSKMNVGDAIHVRDLVLPAGVEALTDEDVTVFLCSEPKVEDETVVSEITQPEVIREKKPDPEAAEKK